MRRKKSYCGNLLWQSVLTLFASAYETEFSRDAVSSYGSPRERAPLAILNDGDMIGVIGRLLARVRNPRPLTVAPSPCRRDPDALRDITSSNHFRVNQDMFPTLADDLRYAARARAQSASFRRCLDQVEKVRRSLENGQQLFERIGYPAGFMCLASACCSELALAAAAREEGNDSAAVRHLREALTLARERDALDRRYNAGKWAHWYDRNIICPYPRVTGWIEAELKSLE